MTEMYKHRTPSQMRALNGYFEYLAQRSVETDASFGPSQEIDPTILEAIRDEGVVPVQIAGIHDDSDLFKNGRNDKFKP